MLVLGLFFTAYRLGMAEQWVTHKYIHALSSASAWKCSLPRRSPWALLLPSMVLGAVARGLSTSRSKKGLSFPRKNDTRRQFLADLIASGCSLIAVPPPASAGLLEASNWKREEWTERQKRGGQSQGWGSKNCSGAWKKEGQARVKAFLSGVERRTGG